MPAFADRLYGDGALARFEAIMRDCHPGPMTMNTERTDLGGVLLKCYWEKGDGTKEYAFIEVRGHVVYIVFLSAICAASAPDFELALNIVRNLVPYGTELGFEWVVVENPLESSIDSILSVVPGSRAYGYDEIPEGIDHVRGAGQFVAWRIHDGALLP